MPRCPWAKNELSIAYHDAEWGVPVRDERVLFEFLILEGAQAGLSWDTILKKRGRYREVFDGFDPEKIARYDRRKVTRLLADPGIVRNRLKVEGAVKNARAMLKFLEVARHSVPGGSEPGMKRRTTRTSNSECRTTKTPGTECRATKDATTESAFSRFLWSFVGGEPIVNRRRSMNDVPAHTPESDAMSKALKKAGFTFVGSTICYAFMQAVGMVNDHLVSCPRHAACRAIAERGERRRSASRVE